MRLRSTLFAAGLAASLLPGVAVAAQPPSVLLIVADDVGYGDLGPYGGAVPTPSIDRLAAQGVRFTTAYAPAAACCPSRAGLATGRQPSRYGFDYNVGPPKLADDQHRGLPPDEITMPEILGAAGLATSLIGKWHLGSAPELRPNVRGFDHVYGFYAGARWQLKPGQTGVIDVWPGPGAPPAWPKGWWSTGLREDDVAVPAPKTRHLTDVFGDRALAELRSFGARPFFLEVAFSAAHEPWQATPRHLKRIAGMGLTDDGDRAVAATIAELDHQVGRILAELAALGRAGDTIVVLVSDNGCDEVFGHCSNGALADGKLRLTEGGLRVPMIVRWPGSPLSGTTYAQPVSLLDLLPTLAAAVQATLPSDRAYDGVDLRPYLRGTATGAPHDMLTWRAGDARAVRQGRWKLVEAAGRTWLFDLAADPGEHADLSAARPDVVAALRTALDAREAVYAPAMWPPGHATMPYYDVPAADVAY